jgi:uncharacterized protein
MKKFCSTAMIVFLLSGSFVVLNAQNVKEKVCLENTEQFSITSGYVKGENYLIQVGLPFGYSSSDKSYPVLYVLDGDYAFGITKGITDLLMIGKEITGIIVVGISYGKGVFAWSLKRTRDLTPGHDTIFAKGQNTGGADDFLGFIQNELFPAVNRNYRTIPDSSAICGESLGGLLNSYILWKQPELFNSYIIISPSLIWNNKSVLKLESEYFADNKNLKKAIYFAYGSLDNKEVVIDPANELIRMIQMHNYKGLRMVKKEFEGETHMSVPSVAITNGLKTIFRQ